MFDNIIPWWAEMKAVRICEKVANGDCTILVSKTAPKCEVPFKCYIYCTKEKKQDDIIWAGVFGDRGKWNGRVIGEFVCDRIDEIYQCNSGWVNENACISKDEFFDYLGIPRGTHFGYDKKAYAWHISDLKIYYKPKELSEFCIPCKVSCENCKNPLYFECSCEEKGKKIVTRPPQSWQYVEEI